MKRVLKTTARHVRRAPYQAASAVLVLTIAFFLTSVFVLVVAGSEQVIRYFESRPQVTAFFKDGSTDDAQSQLRMAITGISGVTSVRYVSKEEALRMYQDQNKDDPLLLEMVTADILPASIEVRAATPDVLSLIAEMVKNHDAVEEVVYQKNIIDNLVSWTRMLRIGGFGLVSFFLMSSMFMVMVIVSMKIASHKTEIEIMRLLGAGSWHILGPFLLEGMLYGVIGSVAGWMFSYIALLYATPVVLQFLGTISLLPVPFWFMFLVLAGEVTGGVLLGFVSSLAAARRFLK